MPIEKDTGHASIDDEAIEVQRPNGLGIGREPTKLEVEHNVAREMGVWSRGRGSTC